MTIINGITSSINGMNPNEVGAKKSLGQEDFLKLMVAQVQHQDPMEPQTNGDFMAQLAQFSTNDGITKMQGSIEQLASSLQSNQALQASSLVGRKVLVNSDAMQVSAEGGAKVAVDLPAEVNNLSAEIYSLTGELLNKMPLGQHNVGQFEFNWDGKNKDGTHVVEGTYKIKVVGFCQGKEVALKTMTAANVDSVSLGQGDGVRLNVAGVGPVALQDVRQITN